MAGPLALALCRLLLLYEAAVAASDMDFMSSNAGIGMEAQNYAYVGCHFSNRVCLDDEECVDDGLFGTCEKITDRLKYYGTDSRRYQLDTESLYKLEGELERLLEKGYTWEHPYTQCRIRVLLSNNLLPTSPDYCMSFARPLLRPGTMVSNEDNLDNGNVLGLFGDNENYNDNKPTLDKRPADYIRRDPIATDSEVDALVSSLSETDLKDLMEYVSELGDSRKLETQEPLPKERNEPIPERERSTIVPSDAKLLSDLIRGDASVSDLSGPKAEQMQEYVSQMLDMLQENKKLDEAADDNAIMSDGVDTTNDRATDKDEVTGEGDDGDSEEKMNDALLHAPPGDAQVRVLVAPNNKRAPSLDEDSESASKDPHDKSWDENMVNKNVKPKFDFIDASYAYVQVYPNVNSSQAEEFVRTVEDTLKLAPGTLKKVRVQDGNHISFFVGKTSKFNSTVVAERTRSHKYEIQNQTGIIVEKAGIGTDGSTVDLVDTADDYNGPKYFVLTFVLFGVVAGLMLGVVALYLVRRHSASRQKLQQLANSASQQEESSKDYQDLCRQRMQSKASERPEPLSAVARVASVASDGNQVASPSSRSSTSSWSEEPVASNMDISTGHIVLSYMEDHLQNKGRLDAEWEALVAYEAEPCSTTVAQLQANARKNRYQDVLPYDHSRVVLNPNANASNSDYINASTITDHDPRNPAYIATQGPLSHTVADFWQMIWEQGSVVIVCLCNQTENGEVTFQRYWPEEGSDLYHIYEVHLVSEHIWCDDYLVRSFYLKNLQTSETRTVTQFHFLTWPDLGVPAQTKALLDFRRKVNKSYRGRSSPIVVHCNDGAGRTGTYTLIDMVLNRMSKGAKEIDIAATLEHIRDQRMIMVKTKEQFEFALATVAEEVHNILKALPQ